MRESNPNVNREPAGVRPPAGSRQIKDAALSEHKRTHAAQDALFDMPAERRAPLKGSFVSQGVVYTWHEVWVGDELHLHYTEVGELR